MTPPDALVRSTSSLAPSSGPSTAVPSEADLALPPKPEPRLSFGIPVLESAKFRLSHDFARLVRSSSSVSSKSTRTGGTASTHESRAVPSDYENEPHSGLPLHPVDLDPHDMPPLFSDSPPDSLSRRAKFYGFLSRSSSRSRSRSKGDTRPSDSGSNESPELPNATTATATSPSVTSDSHLSTVPPTLRPLSNNTTTTGETVTPKNMHTLTSRHNVQAILINDSGIGVDEPLITYDPRMPPPPPPPPVPGPATTSQRTPTKEKRRSKPLFGLPAAPWSRPTTPKNEQVPLPSPPQSPRNRPSKVSKIENWFKHGTTSATPSTSRPHIAAPQPCRPSVPADRANARHRPHSTPPRIHPPGVESSDSERDGRCSPLLGLFTSTRGRGKQREHSQDRHPSRSRKPVVGAPMMRTRTASREGPSVPTTKPAGGAQLPSFEFEHGGGSEVRRSASHNGHRRVVASHGHGNGNGHTHTHANHRTRGHAHSNSLDTRTRGHSHNTHHTHARSPNHTHPTRSHTHPQPNQQHRGATSPHAAPQSPPPRATTDGRPGASAASQSTAGTAATNTTTGAAVTGGTGSWGRVARTIHWVRGVGVHPPFAFESAASSTASASGERRPGTGGSGGADIRERERDRDRERTRRHVVQAPQVPAAAAAPVPAPASPGKSVGSGTGRWEQREVELGLGLTWAPSKIRVREWTPGGTLPAQLGPADEARAARAQREMEQRVLERDGARRTRERLAEYEMGYARSRSRSRKDKEVTGRFREVLGAEGFEAFKKYVRRFDADIIPLEGASGLLGRVERLLDKAPTRHVGTREKREMLDDLVRIVRESEW
ncbi:hypothetical protein EDB89DRAFT_2072905 [Lactarius sanguifluus]|nr:hypothetical protein EDB89DRAFT_2072905 [Lactarius sanguifluus]